MKNNNLIDNKYSFKDLVDVNQLTKVFNKFSKATGFAIGLADNNTLELFIKTGWQEICSNFHRFDNKACEMCIESDKKLFSGLLKAKSVKIVECQHGLYDCATPIIIENKHIANLVTGQLFIGKPDIKKFEKQAEIFGFDKEKYLKVLDKVPIVTEKEVIAMMEYLAELSVYIATEGLNTLRSNKLNEKLKNQNQEYSSLYEEFKSANEQLSEAKEKVEISENNLQSLFNSMTDIVFEIDYNGTIIFIAPTSPPPIFKPSESMLGKKLHEIFPKEEADTFIDFVRKCLDNNKADTIKYPLTTDGKIFWFEGRGIPKTKNSILYIARDITKSILADKAVLESQQRYKVLSDASFESIFISEKGFCVEANNTSVKMFGYTLEEAVGMFATDIFAEESIETVKHNLFSGNTEPYEAIAKRKDGTKFNAEVQGRNFIQNGVKLRITAIRDISVRKKAENNLLDAKNEVEKNQQLFMALVDQSPLSIQVFDKTGLAIKANNAWSKLWQLPIEKMVGKYNVFKDSYVKETGWLDHIYKAFDGEVIHLDDMVYDTKQGGNIGRKRTLKVIIFPIIIKGKVENIVIMHQDVTDIKKYELELIKAKEKAEENNKLKTEFINNMSHEIRTPMNGILGFSGLLNEADLSAEKRKYYTSIIQNSGIQLMRIIDDIIEISKLGTKQVRILEKEVCLNDLLLEQFSIFDLKAKENNTPLYLNKGLSDKQSTIIIDGAKLTKILSNLLENALKFTNKGYIEFGYVLKNNIDKKLNKSLQIFVKDSGIGISSENLEFIFERFSQEHKEVSSKVGGLGLGLSIAKENVELIKGKITVESEKGEGTTFIITLPYNPVYTDIKDNLLSDDEFVKSKKVFNILIVEDEEINYLYLETLLEKYELNIKTIHAKTGTEAIEICKENAEIDFIFMDLKLPVINGFEATKQIKEIRPDVTIVAQTSYSTNMEKEQAIKSGCNDFISKPISKESLFEVLNKYLVAT